MYISLHMCIYTIFIPFKSAVINLDVFFFHVGSLSALELKGLFKGNRENFLSCNFEYCERGAGEGKGVFPKG